MAVLLTIAAFSMFDIYLDFTGQLFGVHIVVEVAIIILCLAPGLYFLRRWLRARRKALDAEQQLNDYLDGVGQRIQQEFQKWSLTETEQRTALYMLKGMSHREIALQCHRSEGTVRQHAVSVYRKASLTSRAEFSAHFLQMLLAQVSDEEEEGSEVAAETAAQSGKRRDITETEQPKAHTSRG